MQPSREPRVSFRWRRVRSPAPAIMPVRILSRCAPRVKPSSPRKAMPKHSETRHLPYSPEQMFDLVSDVKRYPEFLPWVRSEEHTSELQSLMSISYAVFCLQKK